MNEYEPEETVEDDDELDPNLQAEDDLPLFADDRNKAVHASKKKKEKLTEKIEVDAKDVESRVRIMNEHLKNVKSEILHTQQLADAKANELSSEVHLFELSKRQVGRGEQDILKLEIESNDITSRTSSVQHSIVEGNEMMDEFKAQMNWNQDEMEQWALAASQKEEDNLALQKYTRADDVKIKALSMEVERLTKELQGRKNALENETTETTAKQIELEKAAEEFRTLHRDRQKLVSQWQDTITTMERRDVEISKAGEEYALLKESLEDRKNILGETKRRLEGHESENVEMSSKISAKERLLSKARQDLQSTSLKMQEFRDEVEIMKSELSSAASQLMQKRTEGVNKASELEEGKMELEKDRLRFKMTKKRLEKYKSNTMDTEAIAREAEEDLAAKEATLKKSVKEKSALKEVLFRQTQDLHDTRQKEATMIAEISGAQAASRNLTSSIRQLETETLRQTELLYNGEFQIQQMERKVARASGIRTVDETKALKADIDALQVTLVSTKAQCDMLEGQCKKLDGEFRRQLRSKTDGSAERQVLRDTLNAFDVENSSTSATLGRVVKDKDELLVQHDVLNLETRRLQETLSSRSDDVNKLENRKFQLSMSMEERKRQISVHRDVQRAQLKAVEEERHNIVIEHTARQTQVDKLQSKYESLCKMTGLGGDDDTVPPEERTQAYFVIKAAQKREELQRKGDDLDDKIKIAERDLRGLRKSLEHLTIRNTELRVSLHKTDVSSEAAQRVQALSDTNQVYADVLFKRKKELQRVQSDMEEDERRCEEMNIQSKNLTEDAQNATSALERVMYDTESRDREFKKLNKERKRLIKKHRAATLCTSRTLEETAFSLKDNKDRVQNVLYTLGQLALEYPEISDALAMSLQEGGLSIPSTRPYQSNAGKGKKSTSNFIPSRPQSACSNTSDVSDTSSTYSTDSQNSSRSNRSSRSNNQGRQAVAVHHVNLGL